MQIKISDELLNNKPELERFLHYISMKGISHSICTENINEVLKSTSQQPMIKETIKGLLEKQINNIQFKNTIEVSVNDSSKGKITIGKLDAYLSKSPLVVVENEINDLSFIQTILYATGNRKIADTHGKLWEISSIGGCGQIPALLEQKISNKTPSSRIFVLHDSDKHYPQESLSKTHTNIINKCKRLGVKYHTLKRREAENYIIDEIILNRNKTDIDFCNAWEELTSAQKSHYDFKYGFSNKPYNHKDYSGLFSNISESMRQSLHNGFGKDISSEVYIKEHYSYYEPKKITAWSSNVMHEFRKISESIKDIL
ncbi:TPA: hypothetical protein ACMDUA_003576 [Vibrio harveyi]